MPQEISQADRILDAAEQALRRYGVEKTNVVDVARALAMSHGNIYRYFPNKKALLQAVAARWLRALMTPLDIIAAADTRSASSRLLEWLEKIRAAKRRKLKDDPEVFRIHFDIVKEAPEVLATHLDHMHEQIERILAGGVASGEFAAGTDTKVMAKAFLQATMPFHHPALIMGGASPSKADAEVVIGLLLDGLRQR